jgi:general secretion pathway protein G
LVCKNKIKVNNLIFMVKNTKKGFTLIELLVVIAIIGLLATLAVVALGNARQKSRDAKRVSDIKQVQTAMELRYVETEDYPSQTFDGGTTPCISTECAIGVEVTCLDNSGWNTTCGSPIYMGLVPRDPSASTADNECDGTGDALGCDYGYILNAPDDYELHFWLEGNTGGLDGPLSHCANQNGIFNSAGGTCS